MSLINDALKKAQQDRTPSAPTDHPPTTATPNQGIVAGHRPSPMIKYFFGGMILMAVFGAAVAFFMFIAFGWGNNQSQANDSEVHPPLQVVEAKINAPEPSAPSPAEKSPPVRMSPSSVSREQLNTPQFSSSASATSAPVPAAEVASPAPVPAETPSAPSPSIVESTPQSTAQTTSKVEMTSEARDRAIRDYLSKLNIQMVRVNGERSRVMMNGELHGIGAEINYDLVGLRIKEIYPQLIIFETNDGSEYKRPF